MMENIENKRIDDLYALLRDYITESRLWKEKHEKMHRLDEKDKATIRRNTWFFLVGLGASVIAQVVIYFM